MKIDSYACDGCGKRTEDYYEKGWMQTEGRITVSKGRDRKRQAKSYFLDARDRHFCSLDCFKRKVLAS